MKTSSNKMITCGTALKKNLGKLDVYRYDNQKRDLIAFVGEVFSTENVPQEYANEILTNLETKPVKKGVQYLTDIVLKCMGLGVLKI